MDKNNIMSKQRLKLLHHSLKTAENIAGSDAMLHTPPSLKSIGIFAH